MTINEPDQARSETFAERMLGVLNDGALALMTSIGHRTGLFGIMAGLPPSTSEGIASAAGLNERYVREAGSHGGGRGRRARPEGRNLPPSP